MPGEGCGDDVNVYRLLHNVHIMLANKFECACCGNYAARVKFVNETAYNQYVAAYGQSAPLLEKFTVYATGTSCRLKGMCPDQFATWYKHSRYWTYAVNGDAVCITWKGFLDFIERYDK